jgi:hypothetical protein
MQVAARQVKSCLALRANTSKTDYGRDMKVGILGRMLPALSLLRKR